MKVSRVTTTDIFPDTVFLKAHCSCGDDDHTHTLEMEIPYDDLDIIDLVIHHKSVTPYNRYGTTFKEKVYYWWKDKVARFEWIVSIIFRGYVETQSSFMFSGINHIDAYIKALEDAKKFLVESADKKRRAKALEQSGILDSEGNHTFINLSEN